MSAQQQQQQQQQNYLVNDADVAQLMGQGYDVETARDALFKAGGHVELALNHLQRKYYVDPSSLQQLTDMGFGMEQATQALQHSSGNVEQALNALLNGETTFETSGGGGGGGGNAASSHNNNNNNNNPVATQTLQNWGASDDIVLGQFHQYSINHEEGRSACTCIALTAAQYFLNHQHMAENNNAPTQYFLAQMIGRGIEHYQEIITSQNNNNTSVEHLSAEEVLKQEKGREIFHNLQMLPGGVRQGLVNSDADHPMGLKALLRGIQRDNNDNNNSYICVLITKTPETVLVCLPPPNSSSTKTTLQQPSFWLIDSHPRPQLGLANSYAKQCSSLEDLCDALYTLFPPMADWDVPEMMQIMYNSFDLYPFVVMVKKK